MENNSDNSGRPTPDSARSALDAVAASQARAATRISAPWWYHLGLGATLALVFLAMSLRVASWAGAVLVVVVLGLGYAVRRATGVSYERYTSTPGAIKVYGGYILALVLLAAAGMYLEWGAGVHWAIAVAGGVIGVLTVAVGYRVDAVARRDIQAGR
ncbi:hypothetical protein [Streptomyces kronopolitis]